MKQIVPATLVLGLVLAGAAQAQTTTAPSNSPSNSTSTSQSTGATPPSNSTSPAAVTTTSDQSRTPDAPVAGANSFTEGQARSRIEDRGFSQVTDLKKDDKGVWRGTAMKDGKQVSVALDYQGNIVGQ